MLCAECEGKRGHGNGWRNSNFATCVVIHVVNARSVFYIRVSFDRSEVCRERDFLEWC